MERERNEPLRGRRGPPGRVQVVRRAHGVMARGVFDAEPAHAGGGGASMMEPFEALKHARAEMARLGADNAALRREAHTLKTTVAELRDARERDDARTRSADESRRSEALRHLTAAEDHVALLLGESRGRLDAMAREDGAKRLAPGGEGSRERWTMTSGGSWSCCEWRCANTSARGRRWTRRRRRGRMS